jgi:hypothetical protein
MLNLIGNSVLDKVEELLENEEDSGLFPFIFRWDIGCGQFFSLVYNVWRFKSDLGENSS